MSAPLVLTVEQLRDLAAALDAFSQIRRDYDIEVGSYGQAEITVGAADVALSLSWSGDDQRYYIDDRSGS